MGETVTTDKAEWRERLLGALQRRAQSEQADETHAHYADELDYCDDMIEEAARHVLGKPDLSRATTEELMDEVIARFDKRSGRNYRYLGGLSASVRNDMMRAKRRMTQDMLIYRTSEE